MQAWFSSNHQALLRHLFLGPLCQQNPLGDIGTIVGGANAASIGNACPGVKLAAHVQRVQLTCSCYTKHTCKGHNFLSYCQFSVGQPQRVMQKHLEMPSQFTNQSGFSTAVLNLTLNICLLAELLSLCGGVENQLDESLSNLN